MHIGSAAGPIRGPVLIGIRDGRGGPVGLLDVGTVPGWGHVQVEVGDVDWLDRLAMEVGVLRHRLHCARTGRTA